MMRKLFTVLAVVALSACATSTTVPNAPAARDGVTPAGKVKDLRPPPSPNADNTAPAEGISRSGVDFGPWRSNPDAAEKAFAASIARLLPPGATPAQVKDKLAGEGFNCRDANRPDGAPVPLMDCRRGAFERQCGHDWVVELWKPGEAVRARYMLMCLGALR
jgi:hypothetical protein